MSVLRITEFYAMPKKLNQLRVEFSEISQKILNSPGCRSCEVLTSTEGQEKVVVIEEWDSIESHQAAAKSIDPRDFQKILGFLKGQPKGKYYKMVEY